MNLLINQLDGRKLNFKFAYLAAILLVLGVSFFAGLAYTGKQYIFWFFCISANCLILYGTLQKKSFGFLVLCIFLWLGYWLKSVAHLLLIYPFREPMGYFSYAPAEWDDLYLMASLGMLVTITSGFLLFNLFNFNALDLFYKSSDGVKKRRFLLSSMALVSVSGILLALLNINFRFSASGIFMPDLNIPWTFKMGLAWMLSFGLPAALFFLLDLRIREGGKYFYIGSIVLVISCLFSISQASRAVMILSGITMFLGIVFSYKKAIKGIPPLLLIFLLCLVFSVYGSNYRRYGQESPISANATAISINLVSNISVLAIDRWVGLEGLASVVSYPYKSPDLLLSSLKEKRVSGTVDSYTLNIAQAFKDAPEKPGAIAVQYASIAGLFGLLYLADSLPLFCLGIFAIVGLIIFSERAILFFTHNRLLALFWSTSFVFTLSSLTIGVPQVARYYPFSFIAINVFGFLLRKYCFMYDKNYEKAIQG